MLETTCPIKIKPQYGLSKGKLWRQKILKLKNCENVLIFSPKKFNIRSYGSIQKSYKPGQGTWL